MTKKRKKAPSIIFQISDGKSSSVKERGNPEMRKRKKIISIFSGLRKYRRRSFIEKKN
jgi:hypothetical protein